MSIPMEGFAFSPAAERNREPILEVLRELLHRPGDVIEVGCGTGQHAVAFARALPHLTWHPTNGPGGIADAAARIAADPSPNLRPPVAFDLFGPSPLSEAVAIYAANVVHIAPWPATERLFAHAGALLDAQGIVVLYGPFRYPDRPLEPSNAAFDAQLRAGDPERGIRDIEAVIDVASEHGFGLAGDRAMPANNRTLWFARTQA